MNDFTRSQLEQVYPEVLDTTELQVKYSVEFFAAPLVYVKRKEDGVKGTLMFQHMPRFYFAFTPGW
jgi:hypothetical protein